MTEVLPVAPRPPTPPRSSSRLERPSNVETSVSKPQLLVDTPNESPTSHTTSLDSGSGRTRKRVDFSPWVPPVFTPSSSTKHPVRPLPPSRECKSSSSILKASSQTNIASSPEPVPVHSYDNLTDMLKSIMQQLATGNRSTSLDAYATLAGTVKAYNDIPEGAKLKEQLQNLCKYIRRDLQNEASDSGIIDSSLITSALKVAVILVWDKSFASFLTDEFRSFLLDRSILALEDAKTPKAIVLHYVHLLATQNFKANIMTKARANRCLEALRTITERVSGKNVVSERYMVYRKFTEQTTTVMKEKNFWIEDLLEGMCNNTGEIRIKALGFGMAVSTALDSSASVSRDLKKILNRPIEQGQNYGARLTHRLMKIMEIDGEGQAVPKMWAVVVRLLRGNNLEQFERSKHLKSLLLVIQKCFNSTSADIRASAYHAWSQFISIVRPSDKTPEQLRKMLLSPIAPQLNRADTGNSTKSNRTSAASAYCCLLFYSFRPSAPNEQYTQLFQVYVTGLWTEMFLKIPTNVDRACRILMALFWNERPKFWTEARVNEPGNFEPDDIPRVDSKWARKNSLLILQIFGLLFERAYWGPETSDNAFVALAWKSFARTVGEACRKEVIPSQDTMELVSNFLNLLRKIWQNGPSSLNVKQADGQNTFHKRLSFLIKVVVAELGAIPFVELLLSESSNHALVPCPESQLARAEGFTASPLVHLLLLFNSENYENSRSTENVMPVTMVEDVLSLFIDGRATLTTQFRFYKTTLLRVMEVIDRPGLSRDRDLTGAAVLNISHRSLKSTFDHAKHRGHLAPSVDYPEIVELLKLANDVDEGSLTPWRDILRGVSNVARTVKGSRAAVTDVIEPLAKCTTVALSAASTMHTADLIRTFAETKEFWLISSKTGNSRTNRASHSAGVSEVIAQALNVHLTKCYQTSSITDIKSIKQMVDASAFFLQQCPEEGIVVLLKTFDWVLCQWLLDPDDQLDGVQDLSIAKRSSARSLWLAVITRLTCAAKEPDILSNLEQLFVCAFTSPQRDVVNLMIERWNATCGTSDSLDYPATLKVALRRLRSHVDLQLPGLGTANDGTVNSSPPNFRETYDEDYIQPAYVARRSTTPNRALSGSPSLVSAVHRPDRDNRLSFSTPMKFTPIRSRKPGKKKDPPKFLHNDSQVEFTTIESSPSHGTPADSQLMTDHQKEVRDRQKNNLAATFADLRSTPSRESSRLRRSESAGIPAVFAEKAITQLSTPELPQNEGPDLDDHVMSSPTPLSSHQGHGLSEVDVLSSPTEETDLDNAEAEADVEPEAPKGHSNKHVIEASVRLQESLASGPRGSQKDGHHPISANSKVEQVQQAELNAEGSDPIVPAAITPTSHTFTDNRSSAKQVDTPYKRRAAMPPLQLAKSDSSALLERAATKTSTMPIVTARLSSSLPLLNQNDVPHLRSESDEYDSETGLQLSQEMQYYADSWESTSDSEDASDENGNTRKSQPTQIAMVIAKTPTAISRQEPVDLDDTVVVRSQQSPVEQVESFTEKTDSHQADGITLLSLPYNLQAQAKDSSTSLVTDEGGSLKRKSMEGLGVELYGMSTSAIDLQTPSKKPRISSADDSESYVEVAPNASAVEAEKAIITSNERANDEAYEETRVPDNEMSCEEAGVPAMLENEDPEAEVIASLKAVWQKLEQTSVSKEGLRSIADLVFEIRSAAEDSVRRNAQT